MPETEFTQGKIEGFMYLNLKTRPEELDAFGVAPWGKIGTQSEMLHLGLPIPNGLILSVKAFREINGQVELNSDAKAELAKWIDIFSQNQFQVRGDKKNDPDNPLSIETSRDQPTEIGLRAFEIEKVLKERFYKGMPSDRLVLVQAVPEKSVERNLFGAQVMYDAGTGIVRFEIRHDIATALARERQSPDEILEFSMEELLKLSERDLLKIIKERRKMSSNETIRYGFRHTLARYGRDEIKKLTGKKLPSIYQIIKFFDEPVNCLVEQLEIEGKVIRPILNIDEINSCLEYMRRGAQDDRVKLVLEKLALDIRNFNLRDFLSILGILYLFELQEVEYNAMFARVNNLIQNMGVFGYFSPTIADYRQLISDAKKLATAGILQSGKMPKLSIVNTPNGHEFVYWDLISFNMNLEESLYGIGLQIRRQLSERFFQVVDSQSEKYIYDLYVGKYYKTLEDVKNNSLLDNASYNFLRDALIEGE